LKSGWLVEDENETGNAGPAVWLGKSEHNFARRPYLIKKAER
tara:strand:+ start:101 stop:226 length:126 start_codon:yes stop_codon:yes gene_type:complete